MLGQPKSIPQLPHSKKIGRKHMFRRIKQAQEDIDYNIEHRQDHITGEKKSKKVLSKLKARFKKHYQGNY